MSGNKKHAPPHGGGGLSAVFLVVLVDLLGFGIILPLMPYYAARFQASPFHVGLLYSVYSLSQLVFSPLWGAWSDRIGRRPIMLLSTAGSTLSYILFAFSNSLPLLFLSRILAGVMGGNISAAQAYVADVTAPSERAKGMGLIGAAFGIGFALGPAISAVLLLPGVHEAFPFLTNPYALPGIAASLLSFCSFLLVLFWLPESLGADKGGLRIEKKSVFSPAFWVSAFSAGDRRIGLLYACLLVLMIGNSSMYSAFPLFCREKFGMSAYEVGLQFLMLGLVTIFVQGGMIRPLVKKFGEQKLLTAGTLIMIAGFAGIPFASSVPALTACGALLAIGGSLNGPTLTSLISRCASPSRQGAALGSAQGISSLGRVLGPAWGGLLFGWNPSMPFLLTAALLSAAVWLGISAKTEEIS